MRISIEWFLLDNMLMNLAVLALSAALSGFRLCMPAAFAASLSGAVFALLAVSSCPVLTKLLPKLLFALVLALGLKFSNFAGYLRSLLCVLLSAMLLGGLMLILVHLQTNEVKSAFVGGVLLGSVEIRLLLLTVAFAAVLPRCLRYLRNITRIDTNKIPLKVIVDGYNLSTTALIDSGNLLVEPISGLPVVLINNCPKFEDGYPVLYSSLGSGGEIIVRRAKSAKAFIGGAWREMDVMVASAPSRIGDAGAIIGSIALPS